MLHRNIALAPVHLTSCKRISYRLKYNAVLELGVFSPERKLEESTFVALGS